MTVVKRNNNNKVDQSTKTTTTITNEKPKEISKLMGFILATRPWSLTISVTSILLGTAYAYRETGLFDGVMFTICLVGAISLQSLGNVINSYYDFKNKNDTREMSADRTMFDYGLSESNIINLIWFLMIESFICLLFLISRLNDVKCLIDNILPLAAIGLVLIICYTASPIGLKYIALGDLTIFLCFGPILVQSAFISQSHYHDFNAYLYSIPLGLAIVNVLHVNNARDIKSDSDAGSTTIASIIGFKNCYYVYLGLYLISYIYLFKLSLDSKSYIMNLPLILLPKIYTFAKEFKTGNLSTLTEKTGQLTFFFGGLNAIGVLFSLSE